MVRKYWNIREYEILESLIDKSAAVIDIKVLHDKKEIHLNGFSENDMY